jgi:hypothetical protein
VQRSYAALIDLHTWALLTLSEERPIIAFLHKATTDTRAFWGVGYPNGATPANYPQWTWNLPRWQFEPTPRALLSERLLRASALAVKKAYAVREIIAAVSAARYLLWNGALLQETVNIGRRLQAQKFKDDGYPDDDLLRYPYVLQYADTAELPMKTAALEILFKAELDDEILAKTEGVRLKYFNLLKTAEIDTIDAIMVSFRSEMP